MGKVEYKNDVFVMLMQVPEYALQIYNALNKSDYTDVELLQIERLNEGMLLSINNDASFLLGAYINLYEHQSTFNPNMTIRFLKYYADLLWKYIKKRKYNIYGRRRIPLPTPRLVVFYNGVEKRPAVEQFRLSDAFIQKEETYDVDLVCTVYNINLGYNDELLEKCEPLRGYTAFVEKVRDYQGKMLLEEAVRRAIDECIEEGILAEFFQENREEVQKMTVLDCTFEEQIKMTYRDGVEEGHQTGYREGHRAGQLQGRSEGRREGQLEGRREGVAIMKKIYHMAKEEYSICDIATALSLEETFVREVLDV